MTAPEARDKSDSRLGKFIQTYSSFLSSFVIGMAGLIATSIWQYRQSETARVQAASEQQLAKTKADNEWRIARAEILAKNLDVLSAQGLNNADRRFGVLLSLTRANILDPELAVSYALELGKDNPAYMRSVLTNTEGKSYVQLAQAFALTCVQRFGVERAADICDDDKLAERSDAIAALIAEEMEASAALGRPQAGPLSLLRDTDDVQAMASKLAWLFEPYLQDLYDHRRWNEIARFESASTGAKVVASLVLSTARTGELLSEVETRQVDKFHGDHRRWLASYMRGKGCDAECRAHLIEFMLSTVRESDGDYDDMLKDLLLRPRGEVGRAINHIHTRLLWCQIDQDDVALLRDRVLVPTALEVLAPGAKAVDPVILDDLVGLLALTPEPTDGAAASGFRQARALIHDNARYEKVFTGRQQKAQRQRAAPPPMVKKVDLCIAPPVADPDSDTPVPARP